MQQACSATMLPHIAVRICAKHKKIDCPPHSTSLEQQKAKLQHSPSKKQKRSGQTAAAALCTCRSPVEQHVQLLQWHNKPQQTTSMYACGSVPRWKQLQESISPWRLFPLPHTHTHNSHGRRPSLWRLGTLPQHPQAMQNPAPNIAARKHAIKFNSPGMCKAHGMSSITRCMSGPTHNTRQVQACNEEASTGCQSRTVALLQSRRGLLPLSQF